MDAKKQLNSNFIEKGKRVYLTFNDKQLSLIDSLVGELGDDRADVVKTIFLSWLSENGIMPALVKKRMELS
ncbi:TPA: CopG family transcriptional regulator [Candidatus Woesearchaeota archaeon]|nr:CopG family transcriptional regulator [Candidatus Woesearchaeota archaeon]OGU85687.1 MAG: hypothetical protein A2279_06805 [Stygiobacter sp. RIFOXYA12_FULL_38_9]HIH31160.1 CopG family transcriptional regulator [Candidatus Woesearchaeota archaeon]HIH54641.1 CopG family transcriptional regulator [Candidatus Woesearchaeota archaeon]HIJ02306.1 CopG family transcriptional regulator [Candidatus Woesearchaeota archaeon]